ncbi:MAG: sigma-70 family RNA polymerase sigma factor [Bacteroidales bacterium]
MHAQFKPLIIKWLRQSKELYQKNCEDYASMAKVVLLECCTKYDKGRGVPFASYFKITLYNAYANHKKKKNVSTVEFTEGIMGETNQDLEHGMKKELFNQALRALGETDQKILLRICQGFTHTQIAEELGLSKKTVLNRKYVAVQKLKEVIG